jgi:glycosyltransferase involved in cell wall biosynthesis
VRETTRWDIGCDVVDAHFLFPDGVAAVLAAARLGRPVVLTARGSDVNIIAEEPLAGRWIRWAVQRADRLVAVSNDLGERLQALAPGRTVEVICNGVDTDRFRPCDRRTMLRASLGVTDFTVLSVGNLVPLKGHDVVIDAVARLPAVRLIIVGDGPLRSQLAARARALGIADRVHLTGSLPQEDLAKFYAAADVLALASSHEGLPNVVLESLASGTPVIATPTGGAREVLEGCDAGILAERDARAFADGITQFMLRRPAPENVRSQIARFDWRHCAQRLHDVFSDVAA